VIVTSAELLAQASERDIAAHMAALHAVRGAAVIVTDGPRSVRALWLADGTLHTASVIPPLVSPGDTTGAGDLFRAAVVLGLVRGWPWPQTLEHAVAAASAALG
jgi:sugar/nucleoside kinase (ribokinase family)